MGSRGLKCLIADDTVHARELLRVVLEDLGFDILEAGDGNEAVRLATLFLPDVIVLDIGMPKMSGFEAVAAMREQHALHSTPIIALSAAFDDLPPSAVHQAGFSSFLSKPIRPAALRSIISAFVL